jgi:hypothetical protein
MSCFLSVGSIYIAVNQPLGLAELGRFGSGRGNEKNDAARHAAAPAF